MGVTSHTESSQHTMAFRAIRNSRNTRWTQKLGEIFQDSDVDNTGKISVARMAEIYRFYQVELNLQDVELLAHNGNIKRSDFIEYALETKGGFQKDKITSKIHDYLVQGEQLLLFTT